ncbi:winged helix-turn-helix transcriptional regulator [Williamsia sterculiae]|uniref:Transcriptional regulator, HxlR family n=1 Tax=Williamsia sterculiae TaxID=1344003 RepID=A0A1N7GY97_9NOCA|nr:helix-turn-helix domain-containing protein [Williamsia sterculiae]SIS17496.1 transcriptional regulator, HxlR family [Williamsia sterculiae]
MTRPDPELEPDVFSRRCNSRDVLASLTTRWAVLALVALVDGDYRFNALRRRVDGISERMLSQTLQTLERDGFVTRTVLQSIPPRVEYALTDLGRRVATLMVALVDEVEEDLPEVLAARAAHDAERGVSAT